MALWYPTVQLPPTLRCENQMFHGYPLYGQCAPSSYGWATNAFSPASCSDPLCLLWTRWVGFAPHMVEKPICSHRRLTSGKGQESTYLSTISLSATAGALKGWACPLCSQLRSPTGELWVPWYSELSPNLFRAEINLEWWQSWPGIPTGCGRSCFGGMPAKEGRLGGRDLQGIIRAGHIMLAR